MSQSKIYTRSQQKCPVFGLASKLPVSVLPTYKDIIKHYNHIKQSIKVGKVKEPTVSEISELVASDVQAIWHKASMPIVSRTRVIKLIRTAHDEFRKLMKPYKGRQTDKKYLLKLNTYAGKSSKNLFDIAACKCDRGNCKCPKDNKVPADEQDFLHDQRTMRLMFIGGVDRVSSVK